MIVHYWNGKCNIFYNAEHQLGKGIGSQPFNAYLNTLLKLYAQDDRDLSVI
jgi:hypothetical protein